MNTILTTIQFLVILSTAVLVEPAAIKEKSPVLLHVLFRHGNRTPDKSGVFPNDLYINYTYEPYDYSQLTLKGKQTEYAIGQYIRDNYGDLIPEEYTPQVVYAIATNFKRTKMSLELVLTALFPPSPHERIQPSLKWQPIPFNIENAGGNGGIMGIPTAYCPNYISQYWSYILSSEAQEIIASYQTLYDRLTKDAGFDVITPKDAGSVYFTLKSEDDYGLKLPEWASDIWPEVLEDAAAVDYEFSTATSGLKKLSAGFLLKKIIQDSLSKQNGTLTSDRKVFLYSAHEYNVGTMLRALNVYYRHVPPFGATIFFEVFDLGEEYGLRVRYQDYKQADGSPKTLTVPGCTEVCPLSQLQELVADSIPGGSDVCMITTEMM